MKKIFIIFLAVVSCLGMHAQSVGIGTTTPHSSAQLDIVSPFNNKGLLIPRMTSAQRLAIASPIAPGLMVYETTTNSFWFYNGSGWSQIGTGGVSPWTISGNNIYNSNTANVGIGTSSPTSKFHIFGNALIESGDLVLNDPFATVYFKNGTQNKGYVQLRSTDDLKFGTTPLLNTTGNLIFETQGLARMTVQPGGNVGVGYSNPINKLDVNGSVRATGTLTIEDGLVLVKNTTDNHNWFMQYLNTGSAATSRFRFADQGVERLTFLNGGNIGIGTTSPTERLEVSGNLKTTGTALIQGEITTNGGLTLDETGGTIQLSDANVKKGYFQLSGDNVRMGTNSGNAAGDLIFRMNGTDRAVIDNAGNMGIGTVSPTSKLHVAGHTYMNGNGEVLGIDGTSANIGFYYNGGYKSFISQASSELYIGVNGGPLHLDATQIAIGAVVAGSTAYKLAVNGKIICEEVKVKLVSSGWPDYVFANDYKLQPLHQVEQFIQTNKHLPNIPSAAEVEKDGIALGDMQKRMMEKIEEMTLYIIDLQKQVSTLKDTLATVNK
ncbi:MAG: hypothetical protein ABJA37_07395 [Ferruginibacter sp.]